MTWMTVALENLIAPTSGELLWTWRKRHRMSVTLAAKHLSVRRLVYIEAEHDRLGDALDFPRPLASEAGPTAPELLRIRRRRSLVARDDVAEHLGVSHVTYLKLERQADQRVIDLWFTDVESSPTEI